MNIVHFVTDEDYEANQSLAIKPLRDDFIQIYFGKHQTSIGKHSHRLNTSDLIYNLVLNNSTNSSNLHFAIIYWLFIKPSWKNVIFS